MRVVPRVPCTVPVTTIESAASAWEGPPQRPRGKLTVLGPASWDPALQCSPTGPGLGAPWVQTEEDTQRTGRPLWPAPPLLLRDSRGSARPSSGDTAGLWGFRSILRAQSQLRGASRAAAGKAGGRAGRHTLALSGKAGWWYVCGQPQSAHQ